MSKNTSATELPVSTSEDDDEILDLLEVVQAGKPVVPSSKATGSGFEDELDALLGDASGQKDNTFPDPTPVDHKVDANETLDLPDMNDFDALLASLGAEGSKPDKADVAVTAEPLVNYDDPDALPLDINGDGKAAAPDVQKNSIMASLQQAINDSDDTADVTSEFLDVDAVSQTSAEPVSVAKPATMEVPLDDDIFGDLGIKSDNKTAQAASVSPAQPVADPFEAAQAASAAPVAKAADIDPFEAAQAASVSPAQPVADPFEAAQAASAAPVAKAADIDPFEAAQAASVSPSQPVADPFEAAQAASAAPVAKAADIDPFEAARDVAQNMLDDPHFNIPEANASKGSAESTPAGHETQAPADALHPADEVRLHQLDAMLDDVLAGAPEPGGVASTDVLEEKQPASMPMESVEVVLSSLREELLSMRSALDSMSAKVDQAVPLQNSDAGDDLATKVVGIKEDILSQHMRLDALTQEVSGLTEAVDGMRKNIDRMAAEAAVKVIREELLELVKTL